MLACALVFAGAGTGSAGAATRAPASRMPTTTVLTVDPPAFAETGAPVTLTAAVSPSEATGVVQFRAAETLLGTVRVVAGTAGLTTRAVPPGSSMLTADFVPDPVPGGSQDTIDVVVVAPAGPTPDPGSGVLPVEGDAGGPAPTPPAPPAPALSSPLAAAEDTRAGGDLPFTGLGLAALLAAAAALLAAGLVLRKAGARRT